MRWRAPGGGERAGVVYTPVRVGWEWPPKAYSLGEVGRWREVWTRGRERVQRMEERRDG